MSRSPASFAPIPSGHVLTHVEEGIHSIIDVTEPDYHLRDGFVQRRIVVEGDKVALRTFGVGNNSSWPHARGNEEGAGTAFAESTDRIRAAVSPESEKRSQEGWYILTPNPAMGPSRLTP